MFKLNKAFNKALLEPKETLFICIDIQERLLPVMARKQEVVKNTNKLLQGAKILKTKILITEQYKKGLGATDSSIIFKEIDSFDTLDSRDVTNSDSQKPQCVLKEKTTFSIFGDEVITELVTKSGCKNLVIFGIESHVCVLQSTLHALKLGFEVFVVSDALSSRDDNNHFNALSLMQSQGAKIINTESVLFGSMLDSKDANFKAISALVK